MRQSFDDVTGAEQPARDAAIAAMGQRLAAASRRSRQKAVQRRFPTEMPDAALAGPVTVPARSPVLVANRSQAVLRDIAPIVPPRARSRALTALGRAAALASMAAAGFAVVLLAQSPRWSAVHHGVPAQAQASALPEHAGPPIAAAQLTENTVSSPAPLAVPLPARVPAAGVAPAIEPAPPAGPESAPPVVKPVLSPPKPMTVPRPSRPMQVQLASLSRARPAWAKHAPLADRHEGVRMASVHPAVSDHYALPRWLTEAREAARPLIMSPPPHDLEAPPAMPVAPPQVQLASSVMPERPRPQLPPLSRPRLVYAYAGYGVPPAYRGPPSGLYDGYGGPSYPPPPYGNQQTPPYPP